MHQARLCRYARSRITGHDDVSIVANCLFDGFSKHLLFFFGSVEALKRWMVGSLVKCKKIDSRMSSDLLPSCKICLLIRPHQLVYIKLDLLIACFALSAGNNNKRYTQNFLLQHSTLYNLQPTPQSAAPCHIKHLLPKHCSNIFKLLSV